MYDLNLINIKNTDLHIQTKTLETETENLTMNKLNKLGKYYSSKRCAQKNNSARLTPLSLVQYPKSTQ